MGPRGALGELALAWVLLCPSLAPRPSLLGGGRCAGIGLPGVRPAGPRGRGGPEPAGLLPPRPPALLNSTRGRPTHWAPRRSEPWTHARPVPRSPPARDMAPAAASGGSSLPSGFAVFATFPDLLFIFEFVSGPRSPRGCGWTRAGGVAPCDTDGCPGCALHQRAGGRAAGRPASGEHEQREGTRFSRSPRHPAPLSLGAS